MQALINKATAKRPDDRFQNCRVFWEAVVNPNVGVTSAIPAVVVPANGNPVAQNPAGVKANVAAARSNSPVKPPRKRLHWALRLLIWLFLLSLLGFLGTVGYVFREDIGNFIGANDQWSQGKVPKNTSMPWNPGTKRSP